jgi:hypothetical protein
VLETRRMAGVTYRRRLCTDSDCGREFITLETVSEAATFPWVRAKLKTPRARKPLRTGPRGTGAALQALWARRTDGIT